MSKIFSGIRELDELIDSFYVGDNVVWEVEAGTSSETFVLNFVRQSFRDKSNVIYVSFNKSPHTILQRLGDIPSQENFVLLDCFTSGKGKNDKAFSRFYETETPFRVVRVEDPRNIENFTNILTSIEDEFQSAGRYVFDSLTGMQDLWGDENRTYRFFTYLCPRLYDLGTVAYWLLEKDAHSQKFKANLRHITQVVLELYKRKDRLWIKAHKLEGRANREAFKPHSYEIEDSDVSITSVKKEPVFDIGGRIREIRTKVGMSQKELAEKIDLTPSFVSQLESNQITPSLNSFMQICGALGVNMADAFKTKSTQLPWIIRKEEIFSRSVFKENGIRGYRIAGEEGNEGRLLLMEPHSKADPPTFLTSKGKKLLYVLRGDVFLVVNGQGETLRTGDAVYLTDEEPSLLKNEGGDNAEILVIVAATG